jgi:hypothetical protein
VFYAVLQHAGLLRVARLGVVRQAIVCIRQAPRAKMGHAP